MLRRAGAARALLDRSGGVDDAEVRALRATRRELARASASAWAAAPRSAHGASSSSPTSSRRSTPSHRAAPTRSTGSWQEAAWSRRSSTPGRPRAVAGALDDDGDDPRTALSPSPARSCRASSRAGETSWPRSLDAVRELGRSCAGARGRRERPGAPRGPQRADRAAPGARPQARPRLGDVLDRRVALGEELARLEGDEARSAGLDEELATVDAALGPPRRRSARRAEHGGRDALRGRAGATRAAGAAARPLRGRRRGPRGEQVQFLFAGSAPSRPPRSPTPRAGAS